MIENVKITKPAWFDKLSTGGPLPPEPSGGWGKWWGEYDGYVWLIIIAGAIGVVFNLLSAAGERVIKS